MKTGVVCLQEEAFSIDFYDLEDGTKPAEDFIAELPSKMRAKAAWIVGILKANGPKLREPYSKHLDDGIFEIRAQVGSDISRVLYFFMIGKRVILTHGC
jgi:phage-related protein